MILFVCQNGAGKSVIAAAHWNRLADEYGMALRAEAAGLEPDDDVPLSVVQGLAREGFDVEHFKPHLATPHLFREASHVVDFACDVRPLASETPPVEVWDDVPTVSDGFESARDAIVAHVTKLFNTMQLRNTTLRDSSSSSTNFASEE